MRIGLIVFCLTLFWSPVMAVEKYSVFQGDGAGSSIKEIVSSAENLDVLFLGESHDDRVAHDLQFEIFKSLHQKYGKDRSLVLSFEMFERDVQVVLDEYLSGVITETHFLRSSRPWKNYQQDYRPLLEYAKTNSLVVVAANAPRRYVNLVFRKGAGSLDGLSSEAKSWIAPLPFKQASPKYIMKFQQAFGGMSDHSAMKPNSPIIEAQSLWDATMAYSIRTALGKGKKPLVVHLNGSFHTANRLGLPEHLEKYREGTEFKVVTMTSEKDFKDFAEKHKGLGDFVVLTDASEPRSYK